MTNNSIKCGEHTYEIVKRHGYLSIISKLGTLKQAIAVIHISGDITILDTPNNRVDVKAIIDSNRRIRVR